MGGLLILFLEAAISGSTFKSMMKRYEESNNSLGHKNQKLNRTIFDSSSSHYKKSYGFDALHPDKKITFDDATKTTPSTLDSLRPQVHTKVSHCRVVRTTFPRRAMVSRNIDPGTQTIIHKQSHYVYDEKSVALATSNSRTEGTSASVTADVSFSYGGMGASVSGTVEQSKSETISSSQEYTTTVSEQEVEENIHQYEIVEDEGTVRKFWGVLPEVGNYTYELEVTFESTFTGFIMNNYHKPVKRNGFKKKHYNYAINVNEFLNSSYTSDKNNRPPKFSTSNRLTTTMTKVLYQPSVVTWKVYDSNEDATAKQKFDDDLNRLERGGFKGTD
jgi:hypothetical protein